MDLALKKESFIFNNEELDLLLRNEIKIDFDGDFLVSGNKVCQFLGYVKPRNAITNHVDEDDKYLLKNADIKRYNSDAQKKGFRKLNNRGEIFINESGIYALIFGSKKEEAKRFKKWVTADLLPTIRKNGGYIGSTSKFVKHHFQEMSPEDQKLIYMLFKSKDDQRKIIDNQKLLIGEQTVLIEEQKPKVEQFDKFMAVDDNLKIGVYAKYINVGRNKLFNFLREEKILMKRQSKNHKNVPYQKHIDAGHFVLKPVIIEKPNGPETGSTTLITKKGMNYVFKKLNDKGKIGNL